MNNIPLPPKLNSKQPSFFTLPAEIRNQIYASFLPKDHTVQMRSYKPREHHDAHEILYHGAICSWSWGVATHDFPEDPTSLLRTCKAIHAEATPLLYSSNKFVFASFQMPEIQEYYLGIGSHWIRDLALLVVQYDKPEKPDKPSTTLWDALLPTAQHNLTALLGHARELHSLRIQVVSYSKEVVRADEKLRKVMRCFGDSKFSGPVEIKYGVTSDHQLVDISWRRADGSGKHDLVLR